jgi:Right handed beta helix region
VRLGTKLGAIGIMLVTGLGVVTAGTAAATTGGPTLYVSAIAHPGGNGSRHAPFNSLQAVEAASGPGDTIVVLAAPASAPPLDGGITLKPRQSLVGDGAPVTRRTSTASAPRITNTSAALNSGDAVRLSKDNQVRNLVVVNTFRGGIYGSDAGDTRIQGNDISGANTSCTQGLFIYFPAASALKHINGWASVMVDATSGRSSLAISGNTVHDARCADGIDVRASGTARVTGDIDQNTVTRLAQEGPAPIDSVLGIGVQSRDEARVTLSSSHNAETYLGSTGADCEGLFTNETGGTIDWTIDHNTYAHGIGGTSCNGAEVFTGDGDGSNVVRIAHSTFEDNPGDMLETNNLGTDSTLSLTLHDVTVRHTTRLTSTVEPVIPPDSMSSFTGHSWCMSQFSTGPGDTTEFTMLDSHFSDCASSGIFGFYANLPSMGFGSGPGKASTMDIENSSISGVGDYAVHWVNYAALDRLAIKAQGSTFTGAHGNAILGFDQAPGATTGTAAIDLGGGPLHSRGQNTIDGASGDYAETTGYNAFLARNWWGKPSGPSATQLSATNGTLTVSNPLRRPPAR